MCENTAKAEIAVTAIITAPRCERCGEPIPEEGDISSCAVVAAMAAMESLHHATDHGALHDWPAVHGLALQVLVVGAQRELVELRRRSAEIGLPADTIPYLNIMVA